MNHDQTCRYLLKVTLNQCFCDFGAKKFSRSHLLGMGEGNLPVVSACLDEWDKAGFLSVLKPLEVANPDDVCIEVHKPIEQSPY
jgi:hypothetical protein